MKNQVLKCNISLVIGGAIFAAVIGAVGPYFGSRIDSLSGVLIGLVVGALGAIAGIARFEPCSRDDL